MAGFGDSLARRGFVVVLLDFNGHGANTRTPAELSSNLDTAVRHLRSLPEVDPQRISLVGHSMGARAVTHYAATNPSIATTVAISLPSASELPADRPPRLLLLVGAAEFAGFHEAARAAMQASPDRRLVQVPGVEHISILYAPRTHDEILAWLGAPAGPAPSPANRALAGLALLAAFGMAFSPLAHLLLGPASDGTPSAPDRFGLLWATAACALAAVVAAVVPMGWMPIAVTNYVVAFTALAGLALLLIARKQKTTPPVVAPRGPVRLTVASILLAGYAMSAIAIPLHLGVTHAVPGWPRWWLLALTVAGFAVFSYGLIRLCGGGFWRTAAAFAIAVAVLTGAALTGLAPGFLLLVVPLFAVLLAWQAGWTAVLARLAAPPWLTAVVGAILPALPAAVAMPLI
jgi:dienelactone hydrolase